jgi:hypothetical protein
VPRSGISSKLANLVNNKIANLGDLDVLAELKTALSLLKIRYSSLPGLGNS